jgi:hypothetical protein
MLSRCSKQYPYSITCRAGASPKFWVARTILRLATRLRHEARGLWRFDWVLVLAYPRLSFCNIDCDGPHWNSG